MGTEMRRIGRWIKGVLIGLRGVLVVVGLGAFYAVMLCLPDQEMSLWLDGVPATPKPLFGRIFGQYADEARFAWWLLQGLTVGYWPGRGAVAKVVIVTFKARPTGSVRATSLSIPISSSGTANSTILSRARPVTPDEAAASNVTSAGTFHSLRRSFHEKASNVEAPRD